MKSLETGIIGGMFGLELSALEKFPAQTDNSPFLAEPHLLLASARSTLTLLTRALQPKTVWLPSYLCEVLMGAFPVQLTKVRFYAINEQLKIAEEGWLSEIQANDMVLFIDYFGFDQWGEWGAEARRRGAWVIEDAAQALLREHFNKQSHYVVFSPRKFVGVPEGGILMALDGAKLPDESFASSPALWWMEATRASILRAEFDRHGGERKWFEIFQKTEASAPLEPFRMSDLSLLILKHAVDWQKVSERRRDNYKFLASELGQFALFPELTSDVVPLGFPVRVKERDRIRQALFAEKIYPQVHWPIAGFVPSEFEASHRLANEIMTLPCDQRYNRSDMERVVSQLRLASVS
jgi:dTDP-4-amino-4,6-dideoxygalactose transaminase